jgi:hypothetical protein
MKATPKKSGIKVLEIETPVTGDILKKQIRGLMELRELNLNMIERIEGKQGIVLWLQRWNNDCYSTTLINGLLEFGYKIVIEEDKPTYSSEIVEGVLTVERHFHPKFIIYFNNLDDLSDFKLVCFSPLDRTVYYLSRMYHMAYRHYFGVNPQWKLANTLKREFNRIVWATDEKGELAQRFIVQSI